MCTSKSIDGPWQLEPPDSPGDWLWLTQFSCGCVIRSGVAWVPEPGGYLIDETLVELPSGLVMSWEGSSPKGGLGEVNAWRRISLPPREWCE